MRRYDALPPTTDGVTIEEISDGRRVLRIPGRFDLLWDPDRISARDEARLPVFEKCVNALLVAMQAELNGTPSEDTRISAHQAFATAIEAAGYGSVQVVLPDDNVRYGDRTDESTQGTDRTWIGEAIDPTRPVNQAFIEPPLTINQLLFPELRPEQPDVL